MFDSMKASVLIMDFPDGEGFQTLPPNFYDEAGVGTAVLGPCCGCRTPFMFSAETVLSIPIDPATGLPPDRGGDPAKAVKQPLCNKCGGRINENRKAQSLPLIPLPRESTR
jgi:hypothetical protein